MAMPLSGVRRVAPVSSPKLQRLSVAQRVIVRGVLQPATRSSASRPITSAPERTVRTQAASDQQPEAPPPVPAASWLADYGMTVGTVLGIVVSSVTLYMALRGAITDSITVVSREQAASITVLKGDLTASNREQAASNRELAASLSVLKSEVNAKVDAINAKVDANTTSSKELSTKLDALSASIRTQLNETANLSGQVSGLREAVRKK